MRLIRWWGNVVLGFFAGGIAAFFIMNEWYKMAGRNNWYDDDPHWGLFFTFVAVALFVWVFLGWHLYKWGQQRVRNYEARLWKERYIDPRRDREMRDVMPRH